MPLSSTGGQAQPIQVARALVRSPGVLPFDECTSALDVETQRAIMSTIKQVKVGRTTVVIIHRLPVMQMTDRVLVIDDGGVAEKETYDDLKIRKGTIVLASPSCSVMDCTDYGCPCLPVSWTLYIPVSHSHSLSLPVIVYLSPHLGAYRHLFCSLFTVSPHLYRILPLSSITPPSPRLPFRVRRLSVRGRLTTHSLYCRK